MLLYDEKWIEKIYKTMTEWIITRILLDIYIGYLSQPQTTIRLNFGKQLTEDPRVAHKA